MRTQPAVQAATSSLRPRPCCSSSALCEPPCVPLGRDPPSVAGRARERCTLAPRAFHHLAPTPPDGRGERERARSGSMHQAWDLIRQPEVYALHRWVGPTTLNNHRTSRCGCSPFRISHCPGANAARDTQPCGLSSFTDGVSIFIELMTSDRNLKASREGSE